MFDRWICRFAVSLMGMAVVGAVAFAGEPAHPYHVSRAEVAWNPKSGSLEVALCVWPADLEKAIQSQEDRKVDLDQETKVETLIQKYLEPRFLVRPEVDAAKESASAKPPAAQKLRWVGQELGLKEAWLYFEIPLDSKQAGWTIENRVFFELNEDQLNHVQWSLGKQYETFVCESHQPRHAVSTEKLLRQRERRNLAR